jgi:adenosylcobinamide-GDP ribazoletransferase
VPVGLRGEMPSLSAASGWFPLVGALVGAFAGAVGYLAEPLLGQNAAAVLAVAALVVVTGALHQDGLADCADGLGAPDRERRLAIMRDSAIGTFGALALLVWLLLLVSALVGLDREEAWRALVVAAATGRWSALLHAALAPPARAGGLGAGFAVSRGHLVLATLTAGAVALGLADPGHGVIVLAAASVVAMAVSGWARAGLGGRTGDTLGATVVITEVAVVVTLLALR